MASIKVNGTKTISDLAAATAINDADVFLIEVGGVTKKLTGATLKSLIAASAVNVDNTLSVSGDAADAKAVGDAVQAVQDQLGITSRVASLDNTGFVSNQVIDVVGKPIYVDESDLSTYSDFSITETGWYIFARISAPSGVTVTSSTTIQGAAGHKQTVGNNYVDVAVCFEVAATSKIVVVNWGTTTDSFVFKATDLAVLNLDNRVTFYIYDIEDPNHNCATWEYGLTEDTTFVEGNYYYTKDENDNYTLAEVTVGQEIPADTYYHHTKVTFEGMIRNITYRCNTIIDCPVTFILPEIEDGSHGTWFEIRFRHNGSYSSTLVPPSSDVKIATEHTQAETKGINMVDLHYSDVGGAKVWRFMNTHSTFTE